MMRSFGWVIATTLGLVAGGFAFHFPGSFGEANWSVSAAIFGAILGALNGLGVGLLQWFAVGGPRRIGGRLMLAMAIGIGVSHALADGASRDVTLLVVAAAGAAAVTATYARLFAERRPGALAASIVGWAGGWIAAATGWPTRIRASAVGEAGR